MSNEKRRRLSLWLLAFFFLLLSLNRKGCEADRKVMPAAFSVDGEQIAVRIDGAVAYPGVYKFHDAPHVETVMKLAGGSHLIPLLDRGVFHRSLRSGDVVMVAMVGDLPVVDYKRMNVVEYVTLGIPLPVNELGASDWEKLPGIGPKLAADIEKHRQINGGFASFSELSRIPGIGKRRMKELEDIFSPD